MLSHGRHLRFLLITIVSLLIPLAADHVWAQDADDTLASSITILNDRAGQPIDKRKEALAKMFGLAQTDSQKGDVASALDNRLSDDGESEEMLMLILTKLESGFLPPKAKIRTVQSLIKRLDKSNSIEVRKHAAIVLGSMRGEAKDAVPRLARMLTDDLEVAQEAANALGNIGGEAKEQAREVGSQLIKMADPDKTINAAQVRLASLQAVKAIGQEAIKDQDLDSLRNILRTCDRGKPEDKNSDKLLCRETLEVFSKLGPRANDSLPELQSKLQDTDAEIRSYAAIALGNIGIGAETALKDLIWHLSYDDDPRVRRSVATALGNISSKGEATNIILALINRIHNDKDSLVRQWAVRSLWRQGPNFSNLKPDAKNDLRQVLKPLNEGLTSSGNTAWESRLITAAALREVARWLADVGETGAIDELKKTQELLEQDPALKLYADEVKISRESLANQLWMSRLKKAISYYPALIIILVVILISYLLARALLWIRPLWLLRINDALRQFPELKIAALGNLNISLRSFLGFGSVNYHARVLDAWVGKYAAVVRDEFAERETVKRVETFVNIPIKLDDREITDLAGIDLLPAFTEKRGRLLIWGEGGTGKTTLACQIAKWAISEDPSKRLLPHLSIPVLIEKDLNINSAAGVRPLNETVRGEIQAMIGPTETLPDELLEQLLRHGRVLVIVDEFSKMSSTTQDQIRPNNPDFPIRALIVTSGVKETLQDVAKTMIETQRLDGARLTSFVESYLKKRYAHASLNDAEFHEACRQLSLITGDEKVTVLLARLYLEQMMSEREGGAGERRLNDASHLMLTYLNELNNGVRKDRLDDPAVHRITRIVAWECVKVKYLPDEGLRTDVVAALKDEGDAKALITYLEEKLQLIEMIKPAQARLRFTFAPVAEYMAALHLIENEQVWQEFVARAEETPVRLQSAKRFLTIVSQGVAGRSADVKASTLADVAAKAGLSLSDEKEDALVIS